MGKSGYAWCGCFVAWRRLAGKPVALEEIRLIEEGKLKSRTAFNMALACEVQGMMRWSCWLIEKSKAVLLKVRKKNVLLSFYSTILQEKGTKDFHLLNLQMAFWKQIQLIISCSIFFCTFEVHKKEYSPMKMSEQSRASIVSALKQPFAGIHQKDETVVTDIHLQPNSESGELIILTMTMRNCRVRLSMSGWNMRRWLYTVVEPILRAGGWGAERERKLEKLCLMKPYSFVLVDEDKETVAFVSCGRRWYLATEWWAAKGLDEELDAFLKDLENNVKPIRSRMGEQITFRRNEGKMKHTSLIGGNPTVNGKFFNRQHRWKPGMEVSWNGGSPNPEKRKEKRTIKWNPKVHYLTSLRRWWVIIDMARA